VDSLTGQVVAHRFEEMKVIFLGNRKLLAESTHRELVYGRPLVRHRLSACINDFLGSAGCQDLQVRTPMLSSPYVPRGFFKRPIFTFSDVSAPLKDASWDNLGILAPS